MSIFEPDLRVVSADVRCKVFRARVRQRGIVVPNTMDEGRLFAWLVEDGIAGEQPFAEFCRQRRFSLSLTTSIRDVS